MRYLFLLLLFGCASFEYNPLTGKQRLAFFTTEQEIKLGRKLARQVEKEFELIADLKLRSWVNDVGYKLVKVCDRKDIVYHFNIIKMTKKQPNAFALPGGYIYITDAMLRMISDDSELAGVLAHEISHVVLRHSIFKLQENLGYSTLLAILAPRAPSGATLKQIHNALLLLLVSYDKEKELEADRLAVRYLRKAGYRIDGMIKVLKKIQQWVFNSPIRRYYLHTHPYIDERIKAIQTEAIDLDF